MEVWDQDFTSDDLVGKVMINLLEEQFLRPSKEQVSRGIEINHQGKLAGIVSVKSRFVFDEF